VIDDEGVEKRFWTNTDTSLSLSSLRTEFPNAITLKYLDNGITTVLGFVATQYRHGDAIMPPPSGWGSRQYLVACATQSQSSSKRQLAQTSSNESTPIKNTRFEASIQVDLDYIGWRNEVMKYNYFLERTSETPLIRCCVVGISNKLAVTYAHGTNTKLHQRIIRSDGFVFEGSKFRVFPLQLKSNKRDPINVEVIHVDHIKDFVLLEAKKGSTFLKLREDEENILERPKKGQSIICIGLSAVDADKNSKEAVHKGVVMSTALDKRNRMLADITAWDGDSGGALYSRSNKLLGIVSSSRWGIDGNESDSRTTFIPSTEIQLAIYSSQGSWPSSPYKEKERDMLS